MEWIELEALNSLKIYVNLENIVMIRFDEHKDGVEVELVLDENSITIYLTHKSWAKLRNTLLGGVN